MKHLPSALGRCAGVLAVLAALHFGGAARAQPTPTFERDVLPVFQSHCLGCHGGLHKKGGLDLRTAASTMAGGRGGAAVVAGRPEASPLWQALADDDMPRNPLKVSAAHKEVVRRWIAAGARSARHDGAIRVPAAARPAGELARFIDQQIDGQLSQAGVPASPAADDGEFVRRIYLDVVGRIPTRAEAAAFLDDPAADKREKLVEALLASPEYGFYWARLWRDRVAVPTGAGEDLGGRHTAEFHKWLADELNKGRGWDELVRAMIAAEGDGPPVAFVRQCMDDGQPRAGKLAASVSRRFLGIRLECAECHDHPFADWKQDDFWALAAFFSRTARVEKTRTSHRVGIFDTEKGPPRTRFGLEPLERKAGGAVVIPKDAGPRAGSVVAPKYPGGGAVALDDEKPARPLLAGWVASPRNALFLRATVNRLWWQLYGRGLVAPVDDLTPENPPTHPVLLDTLAAELAASRFDLKHLLRAMLLSRAYQRTHAARTGNEADETLYSHAAGKVLAPEVLFDSLVVAAGNPLDRKTGGGQIVAGKVRGPLGARAEFLKLFGTAPMDAEPDEYTQGIPQLLALLNSPELQRPNKLVEQAVKEGGTPGQVVERVFLGVLSRRPTAEELRSAVAFVERRKAAPESYQAVWWALVVSPEFALVP